MKCVTAAQMAAIDRATIEDHHIPGLLLMEHAGLCCVTAMWRQWPDLATRSVLVVAGAGNNGGDGFVVARLLLRAGVRVQVAATRSRQDTRGDARTNLDALLGAGGAVQFVKDPADLARLVAASDLVVEALLGTGSRFPLSGALAALVDAINEGGRPVVAVDLPAGLDPDTGRVSPSTVRATLTVTMGLPKVGFFTPVARTYVGRLVVGDIGFPAAVTESAASCADLLLGREAARCMPRRWADSHKGDYGRVLVVGGSVGMSGAVALAARGAYRAGAGLVKAVVPRPCHTAVASNCPEVLVYPVAETPAGGFAAAAREPVVRLLEGIDLVLLGPGIGREASTQDLVCHLLSKAQVPVVLDADGLRAVDDWETLGPRVIVTPHAAEAAALLGESLDRLGDDRHEILARIVAERGCWTVLKGPYTLVSGPDARVSIVPSGNDGMATAGSGDVLAGLVAGTLARVEAAAAHARTTGEPSWASAIALASYLHGLAGDLAAERLTRAALTAPDILDHVPAAMRALESVGRSLLPSDTVECL